MKSESSIRREMAALKALAKSADAATRSIGFEAYEAWQTLRWVLEECPASSKDLRRRLLAKQMGKGES